MARVWEKLSDKALECKTLDEVKALAKSEGIELSDKEAKEFLDYNDISMSEEMLDNVAGGVMFDTYSSPAPMRYRYRTNC